MTTDKTLWPLVLDTSLPLSPQQVNLLKQERLVQKVLERIRRDPTALHLNFYLVRVEDVLIKDYAARGHTLYDNVLSEDSPACGTVACIAGHVVLAAGATQGSAGTCRFHTFYWDVPYLAKRIWQATYPEGDQVLFHNGTSDPDYIYARYGQQGGPLDMSHLEAFLWEASQPVQESVEEEEEEEEP